MGIKCCYQCTRRSDGCHSTCADYIHEAELHKAEQQALRRKKAASAFVCDGYTARKCSFGHCRNIKRGKFFGS